MRSTQHGINIRLMFVYYKIAFLFYIFKISTQIIQLDLMDISKYN